MDKLLEDAKAALTALPPGPWTASGGAVYAGSRVVAVVQNQGWKAEQIAQTLAQMPDLIRLLVVAAPDTLSGRIAVLEEENTKLQNRIWDLQDDIESIRSERCDS